MGQSFPPTITLNATTWQADQIVRVNPYGSTPPAAPAGQAMTDVNTSNNTALAALRISLDLDLPAGVMSNQLTWAQAATLASYYQEGAVWTNGIVPMTANFQEFGSMALANTTMESFIQTPTFNKPASGCFVCHNNNGTDPNVSISHVFPVSSSTP
jgi:hypothetical protein